MKTGLKILLWVVVIALILLLTLFICMKVGGFGTLGEMFQFVISEVRGAGA